ncbi:MAG: nicotinate-nucleotide adenylyltransferase [Actinomycetota bacterium]|nr:nicotinate-nucleotide adenylyltransferase [Actinomycetota bacterium]
MPADAPDPTAPRAAGRRVGLFGGTFDPPHVGHLVTAIDVREALGLDVVLMVVANEPWQKVGSREISPAAVRVEMVRAAVGAEPGIEVSDVEVRRGGPSYTVDTLEALQADEPDAELVLVVGSDAAAGLDSWERAEDVARSCRIVVVERPGASTQVPDGFDVEHVHVPRLDVSSTELRRRVREHRSLRYLVPDPVISMIERDGLYGEPR